MSPFEDWDDARLLGSHLSLSSLTLARRCFVCAASRFSGSGKHGNVPLHLAAELGRIECARLLLETAADATLLNANGQNP
jgi:ankyrin repeat protein